MKRAFAFQFKRWVAMLCMAVLALVVVGHSDVTAAYAQDEVSYSACCGLDDGGKADSALDAPHHCCCTHQVGQAAPSGAGAHLFGGLMQASKSDRAVPPGLQYGPERPPRALAS